MTTPPAADKPRSGVAWTSAAIAVAAGLLLLTNAASFKGWIAQHPPDAVPPAAPAAADAWWDLTSSVGLTAPRAAVERLWREAQAAAWPTAPSTPRKTQR